MKGLHWLASPPGVAIVLKGKVEEAMSMAFTREESAETVAEVELPDRPISPHPNLVTGSGLEALTNSMSG